MKKKLYTTLFLLAACFTAGAQDAGRSIRMDSLHAGITGGLLDISFGVEASGLELRSDGQIKVEFAIENDDRRLVLPPVVYSGNRRYRYERRRALLSDSYDISPYHIYKGANRHENYRLDYKLSVPYYAWMEHAGMTYRIYTHDCSGYVLADMGTMAADLDLAPVPAMPVMWRPDSMLFPKLVRFLVPEVEEVKARASMISLMIGFPVNKTTVLPDFGDNRRELIRADSLVNTLQTNELIKINSVNICGYASPEGRYDLNERLAKGRSESFKKYLVRAYPDNLFIRNAHTTWVAEDWEGFGRLVEADETISHKQDVLAIVYDDAIAPDTKDRMLQSIVWWSENYGVILREMYPKLRRIELRVDYTVDNLTDAQARELLYTDPDMLSLNEIYRVARYYRPGSDQYREVYEIAARQYPGDLVANNNAAAALLQEGNADEALAYLVKTGGNDLSLINYGAYYYIAGDLEKALEYFTKAKEAGIGQAGQILELIIPGSKR